MAKRIPAVTEEEWLACNDFNRQIIEEFLLQQEHLSAQTLKQYKSTLRIFARWVKDYTIPKNKNITDLKARDGLSYQNYLLREYELSSNAVSVKRSAVSSLCNYIEVFWSDEFPMFRNIYSKAVPSPEKTLVREKNVISREDYSLLLKTLEKENEYQMIAYIIISYITAGRRAEIAQLKKEHFTNPIKIREGFYETPIIRGKGGGKVGKKIKLRFDETARQAVLKWLEVRGEDDNEFVFVRKYKNGKVYQLSPEAFNGWFANKFNKIIANPLTPHALRRSRATHIVEDGMDINTAKVLLNHNSTETTKIYVMKDDKDELDNLFVSPAKNNKTKNKS